MYLQSHLNFVSVLFKMLTSNNQPWESDDSDDEALLFLAVHSNN